MLPKVAHYGGFQSYGDLPYSSLKPGKKQLESNTIYQNTVRKEDELKLYNNTNRWTTLYDQKISKATKPEDYQNVLKVTKHDVEKPLLSSTGKFSTMASMKDSEMSMRRTVGGTSMRTSFANDSKGMQLYHQTIKALKKDHQGDSDGQQNQRNSVHEISVSNQGEQLNDAEPLQTGTEHWKTTYVSSTKDPYAYAKSTRPEWSLNKEAYSVEGGPRTSEYKVHFGERGTKPVDKMSRTMHMPPVPKSDDALKLGTTQASYHIPGYTGHIPKSVVRPDKLDQALGVNTRTTYLKENITENYQTRIPGYSGHKPRSAVNDRGAMRQFCFSTAGERFH